MRFGYEILNHCTDRLIVNYFIVLISVYIIIGISNISLLELQYQSSSIVKENILFRCDSIFWNFTLFVRNFLMLITVSGIPLFYDFACEVCSWSHQAMAERNRHVLNLRSCISHLQLYVQSNSNVSTLHAVNPETMNHQSCVSTSVCMIHSFFIYKNCNTLFDTN